MIFRDLDSLVIKMLWLVPKTRQDHARLNCSKDKHKFDDDQVHAHNQMECLEDNVFLPKLFREHPVRVKVLKQKSE